MEASAGAETRTSSASSELTLVDCGASVRLEPQHTSTSDSPVPESMPSEWTNEKHSLYLKSMEASFVDQLYDSKNPLGWHPQQEKFSGIKPSRKINCGAVTSSGQFKVLQRGNWKKINFGKSEGQPYKVDNSLDYAASPWVQHFKSEKKPHLLSATCLHDTASSKGRATNSKGKKPVLSGSASNFKCFHASQSRLSHRSFGSDTEMSDQNFVDEEKGENANGACSSKKKTVTSDGCSNDQVVP